MKGQLIIGNRCHRCNNPISDEEFNRNIWQGEHYCDRCLSELMIVQSQQTPAQFVIICPHCGSPVDLGISRTCHVCRYRVHPVRCPHCHQWMDKDAPNCPHCNWQNPAYVDTRVRTTKTMQKRISGKVYETAIFEIIGAFLVLGMPFFGLPSMPWLAVALMAFLPFYNFLPSEGEAKASRQRNVESLGAEAAGLLLLKGISKTATFALTVIQFIVLPVSKLIPLAISFFYYFTLPVSYKTTQPFKMMEAWFRLGVGGLIGWFMFLAFAGTSQAMSLTLMSLAFFCTSFPRHREAEPSEQGEVRVDVNLIPKVGGAIRNLRENFGGYSENILNIVFLILMTLSLTYAGVGLSLNFSAAIFATMFFAGLLLIINVSANHVMLVIVGATVLFAAIYGGFSGDMIQIIFLAVWELSVISGLAGGKESRPAMGIMMILMTLFVFSFTATGVMGQAVFGYWWPQIAAFGESIAEPLGPMWEQVQSGMGDAWLMLTNPMAYYDQMNKKQQATKSVVKEGGTTKSIELTKKDLFTSVTGELEPRLDPLIGSLEIQNQGEFDASTINLTLWASWTNPQQLDQIITTGTLDSTKFSCSKTWAVQNVNGGVGTCIWEQTTYPQEIRVVNFMFNPNNNARPNTWDLGSGDNLANCITKDKDGNVIAGCEASVNTCEQINPVNCRENATYVHSGQTLKVSVNLTYDYNVNVSIPIEVINQDKYRSLLQARQITLQELTSQYTGGPVKATLWSQKQPVRSGELSLFVASIVNEGGGTLNQIRNFTILIPQDLAGRDDIELIAQTFKKKGDTEPNGCFDPSDPHPNSTLDNKYWKIECEQTYEPMKPGEYKRVSFFITPGNVSDRKTSLIVGLANYEYIKTGSTSITIANAPWH